jgi:enoyl-CoA hydratase
VDVPPCVGCVGAGDRSVRPMTNESEAVATSVGYSIDGAGVASIVLDDGKANALSHAVLEGLEDALDRAERDSARALTLVGRPGKFSAGFDLSVMTSGPEQARDLLGRGAELGLRLCEFPAPVIFGVTGHALAMGGILLCCADVRIGAQGNFKLGLPEVRIGMPVPAFAVELCRDRLSPRWYTRSIQLAHSLSPDEALDAGFLDELVEPEEVASRTADVAAELAGAVHPGPFRATRRTVRGELVTSLRAALDEDLAAFSVSEA